MRRDHPGGPVRLSGVGRRYRLGGPWVLRGVDLELPGGRLARIEGANGSGKSTLLRLLAGLDAPSEGRITGRGRTAYVPERFPAALPFTAESYLARLGRVHGLRRGAAARAAADWLERLGAGAFARTPMSELSKGSSQKVAVAQALLAAPDLLVLDEAWTGLDTAARAELDRAVAERLAAGGAVVFVDHDPRRLADAPHARYAVVGGVLAPAREADAGPTVVIETRPAVPPRRAGAARTEATALPSALAGAVVLGEGEARQAYGAAAGPGTLRLAVPATGSDAALRALLDARPPWHIVSVRAAAPHPAGAASTDGVGSPEGAAG
ncbi:ATP-binding cassette domain-containing protein [Streptomyces sp. NPDC050560]|uniref:ABC transporter ATP-binding protein n=1 Tax=Streptomyces sp. NPDC050560 TaxID=3365630 RepID=UPI00379FBF9E